VVRKRDVREIIGKIENRMEVGESRTKSVVRRQDVREITGKRENKMGINRVEREKTILYFQIKPMGTPCRRSSGECDLTEYCTGETGDCPPNLFLKNGIPCNNGQVGLENLMKLNVYFIFHDVLAVIPLRQFQCREIKYPRMLKMARSRFKEMLRNRLSLKLGLT
jgi:hypothetical protein